MQKSKPKHNVKDFTKCLAIIKSSPIFEIRSKKNIDNLQVIKVIKRVKTISPFAGISQGKRAFKIYFYSFFLQFLKLSIDYS